MVRSLEIYAAHALSCPSEKVSLSAAAPRVPDVGTPSISRQMFAKSKSFSSQQNQDYEPCDVHVLLQCDDQFKISKDQRKQKTSVKLLKFCLTRRLKNYSQKFQLKESSRYPSRLGTLSMSCMGLSSCRKGLRRTQGRMA